MDTVKKTFTLSLCIIAKDEEMFIEECIKSVYDLIDEIVLVDTGSQDRTVEIALKYGAKVYSIEWENDFSKAKNYAIENSTGDWIIFLDADERLHPDDKEKLVNAITSCSEETEAVLTKILNFVDFFQSQIGEVHYNYRIFRNKNELRFIYPIHENLWNIKEERSPYAFISDIRILHFGYIDAIYNKKKKNERNLSILKEYLKKDPNNFFHNLNIAVEYYNLGRFEEALEYLLAVKGNFSVESVLATRYLRYLIFTYIQLGKFTEAYKIIFDSKRLFLEMGNLDFLYFEVVWYYSQSLIQFCIKKLQELVEKFSNLDNQNIVFNLSNIGLSVIDYKLFLAHCYEKLGNYQECVRIYKEILSEENVSYRLYVNALVFLIKVMNIKELEELFLIKRMHDLEKVLCLNTYFDLREDNTISFLIEHIGDDALRNYFKNVLFLRNGAFNLVEIITSKEFAWKDELDLIYYIADLKLNKSFKQNSLKQSRLVKILNSFIYGNYEEKYNISDIKYTLQLLKRFKQYDLIEKVCKNMLNFNDSKMKLNVGIYLYENNLKEFALPLLVNAALEGEMNYKALYYLAKKFFEDGELYDALNVAESSFELNNSFIPVYKLLYKIYNILGYHAKIDKLIEIFSSNFLGLDFSLCIQ